MVYVLLVFGEVCIFLFYVDVDGDILMDVVLGLCVVGIDEIVFEWFYC